MSSSAISTRVITSEVSSCSAATCADVIVSSLLHSLPSASWTGLASADMPDGPVTVVLPCLNEAASLPGVLAAMPDGYRALVVDNNSTDGTAEVARRHGAEVVAETPPGLRVGGARRRGGGGDADRGGRSTPTARWIPRELPALVDELDRGADMAIGRRRAVAGLRWPWHARLGTAAVCWRLRTRYGLPVHDIAPMRVARRDALLALGVTDRRSGYPLELLVRAAQAGWRSSNATSPTVRAPAASRRSAARCVGVSLRRWTSGG